MKIETLSGNRFDVAIELFLEGKSFNYKGVIFQKDNENLFINSYSEFSLDNTTRKMGSEKIKHSKEILKELINSVPIFKNATKNLRREYAFCCNEYKTGVPVAIEIDDHIEWFI